MDLTDLLQSLALIVAGLWILRHGWEHWRGG